MDLSHVFDCKAAGPSNEQEINWNHPKNSFTPISVKDLPIDDIRETMYYKTRVSVPTLLELGYNIDSWTSTESETRTKKFIFTLLMPYEEAFKFNSNSHPLEYLTKSFYDMPPDWKSFKFYTPEVKTFDDLTIMSAIKWLWANHRSNYDAWMKMITAILSTHRRKRANVVENNFINECDSTMVSALIGPRGLCHGLRDLEVPKLRTDLNTGVYNWPPKWVHDFDIDDNSSFHSSSPNNSGYDSDSADSGPIGVAYNRPRITGFTSFTETSDEEETSRLDIFINGRNGDYWDRRLRKRFDLYMRTSCSERRNRRVIREARRSARLQYDTIRRCAEPVFNAEAKRAEALAAERVRVEIRAQENKQIEKKILIDRAPNKPLTHYLYRFKQYNHALRSQLEHEWKWYYGEVLKSLYVKSLENHISLNCWISPVQCVRQTGQICDGFSSMLLAITQLTTFEIIMGQLEGRECDEPRELLRQFPNGAQYLSSRSMRYGILGVHKSVWYTEVMTQIVIGIRDSRISHWSDMFNLEILVTVATFFMGDLYNIRLVRRDLLANNSNDTCSKTKRVKRNPGTSNESDTSTLSIVQHLIRGHLVAVCFDADDKLRPTNNGGQSAHWTMLCGVIVGRRPPVRGMFDPANPPTSEDLGYEYEYDTDTHLLAPLGFRDQGTGRPVDVEELKRRDEKLQEQWIDDCCCPRHENRPHKERRECQECTAAYVDTRLDLEKDGDTVWVVSRDCGRYRVWSLRELAISNRQLRKPNRNIINNGPQRSTFGWLAKVIDEPSSGHDSADAAMRSDHAISVQNRRKNKKDKLHHNRIVCTALASQMRSLAQEYPYLTPSELIEMLDLRACTGSRETEDSVKMWLSAAKVVYKAGPPPTDVASSSSGAGPSSAPTMPAIQQRAIQMPEAPSPPPLPMPTTPSPMTPPSSPENVFRPSVFQRPDYEQCLARCYVLFEPKFKVFKNNSMDFIPDESSLNEILADRVQFSFLIDGLLAKSKYKQPFSSCFNM
ncbi:uncharacterized protein LOC112596201 [Melanaphis sacchari]|uniref:uncharacterized protein LOC112596201 n=1 Tax=Melanaphis sacchari TaxID=742174 RepID=UPI000DC1453C|nr:uncharacterized protein LOC112596201 [Melanaphis sacchari]